MDPFSPGRIGGFDHFDDARKEKEARRTRNAVRDLLAKSLNAK